MGLEAPPRASSLAREGTGAWREEAPAQSVAADIARKTRAPSWNWTTMRLRRRSKSVRYRYAATAALAQPQPKPLPVGAPHSVDAAEPLRR